MVMVSVLLIADYLIGTSKLPLTPMHVNKLAYISHGFTLALEDEPLFRNRVEAWRYGPVIPSLYHELKMFGGNNIPVLPYCETLLDDENFETRLMFTSSRIPDSHRTIIDRVMVVYGEYSALGLSTITHEKGTPWHQCYRQGRNIEIPDSVTKEYYKGELS